MKILFRTMRYNWRYIFSKSNKIAVEPVKKSL